MKQLYEFNKASLIMSIIVFIMYLGVIILLGIAIHQNNLALSNFAQGLILGLVIFPVLGVTNYSFPPIFTKVKKNEPK